MDLLYHHCADLGVDVEWSDLGERRRGEYRHHQRVIVLNRRLTGPQVVTTLAHETGHARAGDATTSPAIERRASEIGASLVITAREYADAERLCGPHPAAIAAELGVTPHLVEAWCRWYRRRFGWAC
jgi:Zn-dependent peptidase ImmA (M78 family)